MIYTTARRFIGHQLYRYAHSEPTLGMLLEEVGEYARALEGRHPDPPCLELVQIASIATRLLMAYSHEELLGALQSRYGDMGDYPDFCCRTMALTRTRGAQDDKGYIGHRDDVGWYHVPHGQSIWLPPDAPCPFPPLLACPWCGGPLPKTYAETLWYKDPYD